MQKIQENKLFNSLTGSKAIAGTGAVWLGSFSILLLSISFFFTTTTELNHILEHQKNYIVLTLMYVACTHLIILIAGYKLLQQKSINDKLELKAKINKIQNFDPLTTLPNRKMLKVILDAAMQEASERNTLVAILSMDIDSFKLINKAIGKSNSDKLLQKISERIKSHIGEGNSVARTGGDEFVVILNNLKSQQEIKQAASSLMDELKKPCQAEFSVVKITVSMGISVFPENNYYEDDLETLVRHADIAMLKAKAKGKGQYQFFDPSEKAVETRKSESIESVLKALRNNEMILYYQPKLCLKTNTIKSFEALIRWNSPKRGIVAPSQFLPYINGNKIIIELDEWVLQEAFFQLRRWKAEGFNTVISVNITSESILSENFIKNVENVSVRFSDVPIHSIQLEVLETSLLADIDLARERLNRLRSIGIKIALDDFGTGYSSLGYLKNLPTDIIKIDQSFIRGLLSSEGDQAIVKSVIQLSKAFKMQVVAEGVEDEEILNHLKMLECDIAQGYYISKPMPANTVISWSQNQSKQ